MTNSKLSESVAEDKALPSAELAQVKEDLNSMLADFTMPLADNTGSVGNYVDQAYANAKAGIGEGLTYVFKGDQLVAKNTSAIDQFNDTALNSTAQTIAGLLKSLEFSYGNTTSEVRPDQSAANDEVWTAPEKSAKEDQEPFKAHADLMAVALASEEWQTKQDPKTEELIVSVVPGTKATPNEIWEAMQAANAESYQIYA